MSENRVIDYRTRVADLRHVPLSRLDARADAGLARSVERILTGGSGNAAGPAGSRRPTFNSAI
jgi:hypothetical protein